MRALCGPVLSSLALALAFLPETAPAAIPHDAQVRAILARHDPDGRLPHTSIRLLGEVRSGKANYEVYYLEFINPLSQHGQQRIAMVANGNRFAGAYQCTLGAGMARIRFAKDRFTVSYRSSNWVVRFDQRGPTKHMYFCGEGWGWENSI